jgi:uncharacterized membrane protein YfcA
MLVLTAIPAPHLGGMSLLGNPWLDLVLLLVAGVAAGVINTMAGGGSFLTLPILIGLGLPAGVANGTSRVSVLAQNIVSAWTFHHNGVRAHELTARLLAPVLIGAGLGSWLATQIDDQLFRPVIGVVLLVWAVILAVKPDRFLHPPDHERAPTPMSYGLALVIGIYGGFLQAGVGFPLIALLSGQLGYDLVRTNAIKAGLIAVYTCIVLVIFAGYGQVAWTPALVLAGGTMLGGWIGARWQLDRGSEVVRWVVLVMVVVAGVSMLASLI